MENHQYSKLKAAFETTLPQMPTNFTDRVMKRIEEQDTTPQPKRHRLWLYSVIGAVAASIVLLLMLHYHDNNVETEKNTTVAQQTGSRNSTIEKKGKTPAPMIVQEEKRHPDRTSSQTPLISKEEKRHPDETSSQAPLSSSHEERNHPNEASHLGETGGGLCEQTDMEPIIPPKCQELVDIYLAETALQVAYERLAQISVLKAYTLSIEEEEPSSQPIIAF
ncbi:MAG: hypothetical protein SPL58_05590 [Bacteroidaceae bacterium]|nr:hypothetical protein [Bacteroidaceae bacterium]